MDAPVFKIVIPSLVVWKPESPPDPGTASNEFDAELKNENCRKQCVWNCSLCLPRRLVVLVKRKAVNLHELIVKDDDSGSSEENEVGD